MAHLKLEDLRAVEILGGGSRIPLIREKVATIVGQEPTQSLNADECCGIGAGYIAAVMSPMFRLPLVVHDVLSAPVTAKWDDHHEIVFDRLSVLPASTGLTIKAARQITISIFSGDDKTGTLTVDTQSESQIDVLVKFQLSVSSIVDIESVLSGNRQVPHSIEWRGQAVDETIRVMADIEAAMAAADRSEELIDETKNELEAALFGIENELKSSEFFAPAERENAEELIRGIREWVEENEFDRLPLEEYKTRLELVHACAEPIQRRRRESEERAQSIQILKKRIGDIEKAWGSRSNPELEKVKSMLRRITEQVRLCELQKKWDDPKIDIRELSGQWKASPNGLQN
jgi:molecular chaperone DnaK (HSP70)